MSYMEHLLTVEPPPSFNGTSLQQARGFSSQPSTNLHTFSSQNLKAVIYIQRSSVAIFLAVLATYKITFKDGED